MSAVTTPVRGLIVQPCKVRSRHPMDAGPLHASYAICRTCATFSWNCSRSAVKAVTRPAKNEVEVPTWNLASVPYRLEVTRVPWAGAVAAHLPATAHHIQLLQ